MLATKSELWAPHDTKALRGPLRGPFQPSTSTAGLAFTMSQCIREDFPGRQSPSQKGPSSKVAADYIKVSKQPTNHYRSEHKRSMMTPSPPRRRLVGVSTKMYFSVARTRSYVSDVLQTLSQSPDLTDQVDVFIIPDHITLASVVSQISSFSPSASPTPPPELLVGAQDAFWEDTGAYTGEVSPAVLSEVGCRIVELGHAERRRIFHESDEATARKAAAAARNGLIPLVCIGERTEGEIHVAVDECRVQVEAVMAAVPDDAEVILAYEPVWAIGAAEPAGAEHVVGVVQKIRGLGCVEARRGTTRILYGGSAGPGLFEKLKDGVDGLFLGRFAHDPKQFHQTILEIAKA